MSAGESEWLVEAEAAGSSASALSRKRVVSSTSRTKSAADVNHRRFSAPPSSPLPATLCLLLQHTTDNSYAHCTRSYPRICLQQHLPAHRLDATHFSTAIGSAIAQPTTKHNHHAAQALQEGRELQPAGTRGPEAYSHLWQEEESQRCLQRAV